MRLRFNSGIALGPILFIIAVLAILAAAIAAGSGGFNANTNNENVKTMAELIVQSCDDHQRAVQRMVMDNGCEITAIDWTPNGGAYPAGATWTAGDYTGGNGTNQAGNGQCALYDPRGGGLLYKQLPAAALAAPTTGAYSAAGGASSTNADAYAGYPWLDGSTCLNSFGTCSGATPNATIILEYYYLNYQTCLAVNQLLNISWDPKSTFFVTGFHTGTLYYPAVGAVRNYPTSVSGGGFSPYTGSKAVLQGCSYDYGSNTRNSAFMYSCAVLVR